MMITMAIRMIPYGAALRVARDYKGMTQREAAEAIGMPLRTYQAHEQGTESPSIEFVAAKVAPIFGWDLPFMIEPGAESSDKRAWFNGLVPGFPRLDVALARVG